MYFDLIANTRQIDSIKKSQSGTGTAGAGAGSKPDDDSPRIFALHKYVTLPIPMTR